MALGLGYAVQNLQQIVAQRRAQRMQDEAVARQETQQKFANDMSLRNADLAQKGFDLSQKTHDFEMKRTGDNDYLKRLELVDPKTALNDSVVQEGEQRGLGGYMHTIKPEQGRLPSQQMGGLMTLGQDQPSVSAAKISGDEGAVPGTYRSPNITERENALARTEHRQEHADSVAAQIQAANETRRFQIEQNNGQTGGYSAAGHYQPCGPIRHEDRLVYC